MDGELVPNGMVLAYRAAPGPGGACTAIAFPFPPLLLPAKRKPKEEVSLVELPSATNHSLQREQSR